MLTSLKFKNWPVADQAAWSAACTPKQGIRRGGRAAHLKSITRRDLERRYGYFLTYLDQTGELDPCARAAAQVSAGTVDGYLAHVRGLWSSVTVAQTTFKLLRMGKLLAPERDWDWLREVACDCDLDANPKPRFDRIVTTERLAEAGLGLIRSARANPRLRSHWRAAQIRNGLMVALLAHVPIRLKNFSSLTLDRSFRRVGARWWIILGRDETKSGRADERPVPRHLNRAIATFLTYARPTLLGKRSGFMIGEVETRAGAHALSGALWIGEKGDPLGYSAVEQAIMRTTRQTLGRALSPHDFRRCAATSARYHAGNEPNLASALLQHQARSVTENYNLASSLEAARRFRAMVDALAAE